jgi:hypothetical protein
MGKVGTFLRKETFELSADDRAQSRSGPKCRGGKRCLAFSGGEFDRIEVLRIRRKVKSFRTSFDRLTVTWGLVHTHVVDDDHATRHCIFAPESTLGPNPALTITVRGNRSVDGQCALALIHIGCIEPQMAATAPAWSLLPSARSRASPGRPSPAGLPTIPVTG